MISHDATHASLPVRSFNISEKRDSLEIFAEVYELGSDCLVILWGGTIPHIGAVGIAQVRPSLRDPEKVAATSSVFTFVGHKEDVVAKAMSEELARRLARNTVVVAGIHWDALTDENIKHIIAICQRLMERIVEKFSPPSI
jgi:hypothetical protein